MQTESSDTNGVLADLQTDLIGWGRRFWKDLVLWWRWQPDKAFFFALLLVWLALFQFWGNSTLGYVNTTSLPAWMLNAYRSSSNSDVGDDRHGMFVPFVVLGLFWWKRRQLMSLKPDLWMPAALMIALALVLHIFGYVVQQPRISIAAMFLGVYGITGLVWGREWLRASFFPFFIFAFCIPFGSLAEPITFRLRLIVSESVEFLAHSVLGMDVVRQGTNLTDSSRTFGFDVAAPCAGMRSLTATVGLALVYAFVSFESWWKRGLLLASAFPLAVVGNLVRMMTIVIAASLGGQSAGNFVHDGGPAGIISLLPYCIPFGGLLYLGHLMRNREAAPVLVGARQPT